MADTIDVIREAGKAQLLLEITYSGRSRLVEPYSFRTKGWTGNTLLFAFDTSDGASEIKSFVVAKIQHIKQTNTHFTPRYDWKVEF
jgi:hypothetical protein